MKSSLSAIERLIGGGFSSSSKSINFPIVGLDALVLILLEDRVCSLGGSVGLCSKSEAVDLDSALPLLKLFACGCRAPFALF